MELNPDLRRLAATQAKRTAASDLRHCATGAGRYQCCEHDILQTNKPIFFANWYKWSTWQGHDETVNFRGQEVKVQGHRSPKLDLEAWRSLDIKSCFASY